ncbi:hypothetical protein O6H91_02G039300 [Diphasiastrum complanatum]|uniref:Uncharacterized protein n=1 Tax=Diphasiastrum complanatum TaxID=34168 RepID=A0ACC2EEK6_DIPCM|nr:hypothetical protein O6H91_02G039300 [Diphasiastrum complanatum]
MHIISGGADVWVNERRFKILKQIGEGGFAFVYLVKEQQGGHPAKLPKHPKYIADDGLYALKKVIIQTDEQLDLVQQEIHVSSLFNHPNLLPLLEHSIISVKGEGAWIQEAYLLFPVYEDGTLVDNLNLMRTKKEYFPTLTVLQIFKQICEGLKVMHTFDPPYAHNDVKPGNVLLSKGKEQSPLAVLMDFGSAAPARKQLRSRSEALALQEWAAQHCSAPYRAPELWDCPSVADIDGRTDIWSLGCTLYAIMYGVSPFEYTLGEAGGSLQLAAMSGQVKWPSGPSPPYPDSLQKFVIWMLEPRVALRPSIEDVLLHIEKLVARLETDSMNRNLL